MRGTETINETLGQFLNKGISRRSGGACDTATLRSEKGRGCAANGRASAAGRGTFRGTYPVDTGRASW